MSGPVLKQLHKCLALYWSSYTNVWPCIEASNRVAMSKMFEQVKHENDDAYRQEFLNQ
jgi:hypothetical protein